LIRHGKRKIPKRRRASRGHTKAGRGTPPRLETGSLLRPRLEDREHPENGQPRHESLKRKTPMSSVTFYNSLLSGNLHEPFPPTLLRMPSPEASLISLPSKAWSLSERFESLLGGERFLDESFQQAVQPDLKRKIYTIESSTQKRLDDVNAKRMKDGKEPIDFMKTTREIEQVMDDSTLTDKQKKDKIEQIRKRLGLSKKDMKALFTKRLGKIYEEAAKQIQNHLNQLKDAVKQAEKFHGKDSPQAVKARERLTAAQSTLQPTLNEFQHKSGLYKSMYPSFW